MKRMKSYLSIVLVCILALNLVFPALYGVRFDATAAGQTPGPVTLSLVTQGYSEYMDTNGESTNPAISADGRYVAFTSSASNLIGEEADPFEHTQVYVHDRLTGLSELVSVGIGGSEPSNGMNRNVSISADGQYVAFESDASNLVSNDLNSMSDIFVWERMSKSIQRVSIKYVDDVAVDAAGHSMKPSISTNGQMIAFSSYDSTLDSENTSSDGTAVYRASLDASLNTVEVVRMQRAFNGEASSLLLSGNGRYVVFEENMSLYMYDFDTGSTKLLQEYSSAYSYESPVISADGIYVAFREVKWVDDQYDSASIKVMDTTLEDDNSILIGPADDYSTELSMSNNGRYVTFVAHTSLYPDIAPDITLEQDMDLYMWDRQSDTVTMASNDLIRGMVDLPSVSDEGSIALKNAADIKVSYRTASTVGWGEGASLTFELIEDEPNVSWPSPESNQIEGFHIYKEVVSYSNTTSTLLGSTDSSARSFSLEGAAMSEGHRIKVYAINHNYDASALPLIGNYQLEDTTPPYWIDGVSNFRSAYVTADSASLYWNMASDDSGIEGVDSYKVWRIVGDVRTEVAHTQNTHYPLVDLQPGTSYTLVLQVGDVSGNWSVDSAPITFQTMADNAETGQLTALYSDGAITLDWTPAQHAAGITTYQILRNASGEDGILLATVASSVMEYTDTTAGPGRQYYYQIKGHDSSNNVVYQTNLTEVSTGVIAPPVLSYNMEFIGEQLTTNSTIELSVQAETDQEVVAVIHYETWLDDISGKKRAYPRQVEHQVELEEQGDQPGTYTGSWVLPEGAYSIASLQPAILLGTSSKVWGDQRAIGKKVVASAMVSFNLAHLAANYRSQIEGALIAEDAMISLQVQGQDNPIEMEFEGFDQSYTFNDLPGDGTASVSIGQYFSAQQIKLQSGWLNRVVLSSVQINSTLTVIVKDTNNQLLGNIAVKFYDENGDERFRGRTDDNGEVTTSRLPIGSGTINVDVQDTLLIPQAAKNVEISITPIQETFIMATTESRTLKGVIKDSFGTPIQGVNVGVSQNINGGYTFNTGITDVDGTYMVNAYEGESEVMLAHKEKMLKFPERATINLTSGETIYSPIVNRFEEGYVFLKLYLKTINGQIKGPYSINQESLSKWKITIKDSYGEHATFDQYPIRTWGAASDEIELCIDNFENQAAVCSKVNTDQDNSAVIELTIEEQSRVEARFIENGSLYQLGDLKFHLERWQEDSQQWVYDKQFSANPLSVSLPVGQYRYEVITPRGDFASGEFETRLGDLLNLGDITLLQNGKFAGKSGNGLSTSAGQVLPGETVTMRGAFKNTSAAVTGAKLIMDIPRGTELVAGSISVQYLGSNEVSYEATRGIVNIGALPQGGEGTFTYKLKIDETYELPELLGKLHLSWDGGEEVIGRKLIPTSLISLVAPTTAHSDHVHLNGRAPGQSIVTIYDGETVIGQTMAYPGGYWSKEVQLADRGQPSRHDLRAETELMGNIVVTPTHTLMFTPEAVRLELVVMKQFNGKEVTIQPENGVARFPFTINPYAPTSFAAHFSDPELIEVAQVTFTGDESVELEKDEQGVFRADIIPGYKAGAVYIEYKAKNSMEIRLEEEELKSKLAPHLREFEDEVERIPADPTTGRVGGAQFVMGDFNVSMQIFSLPDDGYQLTDEEALAVEENAAPSVFGANLDWSLEGNSLIMKVTYYEEVNESLVSAKSVNKRNVQVLSAMKTLKKIQQEIVMTIKNPEKLNKLRKKLEEANETIEEGEGVIDTIRDNFDATVDFSDRMNRLASLAELAATCPETSNTWSPHILRAIDSIAALSAITMVMSVGDFLNPIPFDMIGLDPIGDAVNFLQTKGMDDRIDGLEMYVKRSIRLYCKDDDDSPSDSSSKDSSNTSGNKGGNGAGGSGWAGGKAADPVYIYDPSGYIYEATTDNRVTDATVSLYELQGSSWNLWDAEWFGLTNPQISDTEGKYGWDVPFGKWKVVVNKEGYLAVESEELTVPPQHFDVNLPIVSLAPPIIESVQAWTETGAASGEVIITFSRYIEEDEVGNETVVVSGSNGVIGGHIETVDVKKGVSNQDLVKAIRFVSHTPIQVGESLTIFVDSSSITSYAGVPMTNDEQRSVAVTLKDTSGPELESAVVGANGREIRITFSEALDLSSHTSVAGILLEGTNAVPVALGMDASQSDGRTLKLLLSQSIASGDQVKISIPAGQLRDNMNNSSLLVTKRVVSNSLLSANARLTSIDVYQNGSRLSIPFNPNKSSYTVDATVGTAITIGATAAETQSKIRIDEEVYSGSALSVQNETDISIVVTAPNGITRNYYSLSVNRIPAIPETRTEPEPSANSRGRDALNASTINIPRGEAGQLSVGDEISLVIPKDAFGQEIRITINKIDDIPTSLHTESLKLLTAIFELTKSVDGRFIHPVTISMRLEKELEAGQAAAIYYYDETDQVWVKVGGIVDGLSIRAEVDHFTKFAAFAYEPAAHISDVRGHWAFNVIARAIDRGIASGYPDLTFRPNTHITRAEFAVMLSRTLELEGEASVVSFTDAAAIPNWASNHIALAVKAGLISGYGDGTFKPNKLITRAEMVVLVARAMEIVEAKSMATSFADDVHIPLWAKSAVSQAVDAGIIVGKNGNRFAPMDHSTRAEAVTILIALTGSREQ